jgi:predicted ATPase
LVGAEFLYQQGLPPQATYRFKHALIQDAAYQSLLKSTRQRHHQHVAQVLEARFPELCETQPELLAHHYTEAGVVAQAISYWQRAGQRAVQRSANLEAISHLTKGLELLRTLPETPECSQQELDFLITLGPVFHAVRGQGAPEVERTYARARELCGQVGETPQLFPVLWGLWYFYLARTEYQTARELGEQLLNLAQRLQDPALLLAHRAQGQTLCFLGELPAGRLHLEQAIARYDLQHHRPLAFDYGQDPAVVAQSWLALALWLLGFPDQALQKSQEAITLAGKLDHPYSLVYALIWAATVRQFRRERQATCELTEDIMALSREQGFTLWVAWGMILQGWELSEQGQGPEGMAQICEGIAAWRATGAELFHPHFLTILARAYAEGGQATEGLSTVAEALAIINSSGERLYEAELYRLKGELLLQQAPTNGDEVETCFRRALEVAHRQQAKSLELRGAISLGRLWQRHGKKDEARQLLAEIYGWFTEGFDTADLQEAKALLEELQG